MKMEILQSKFQLTNIKKIVSGELINSEIISFSNIENFPIKRGVYIVYKNDTGATLRKKVQKINEFTAIEAIDYIRKNFVSKFILMNDESEKNIKAMEHFFIGVFNPKYND